MTWGINGRRLAGQPLGVARYIQYLLKYWATMAQPDDRGVVYLREPLAGDGLPSGQGFEVQVLKPKLTGILWENFVLSRRAGALDVLFCPSYTAPLAYRGSTVVAIHSMNEVQRGTHPWWYHLTYSQVYRLSARRADKVIVPSRSTLEDIQTYYGLSPEKIAIVPQGADEAFRPTADEELLREVRVRYLGADRPFVLFVGKLSQRRNIPLLLSAFADLKRETDIPHTLLLMGPNHLGLPLEHMARDLGVEDSVVQTDGKVADHAEVALVYNAADLYVNPSSYEGFSLTLVEAMACGTPVVALNRGALPEIAGDSALLVDDPTRDALADAMRRALTDSALRGELRTRGLERARAFRWEDTARQTLGVLREVAQEG